MNPDERNELDDLHGACGGDPLGPLPDRLRGLFAAARREGAPAGLRARLLGAAAAAALPAPRVGALRAVLAAAAGAVLYAGAAAALDALGRPGAETNDEARSLLARTAPVLKDGMPADGAGFERAPEVRLLARWRRLEEGR